MPRQIRNVVYRVAQLRGPSEVEESVRSRYVCERYLLLGRPFSLFGAAVTCSDTFFFLDNLPEMQSLFGLQTM